VVLPLPKKNRDGEVAWEMTNPEWLEKGVRLVLVLVVEADVGSVVCLFLRVIEEVD
jgi:hypothetical protein